MMSNNRPALSAPAPARETIMTNLTSGIRFFALFAAGFTLLASPALADEVSSQLRQAETLARQGKSNAAYAALEKAGAAIIRRLSNQYAKTFPGAPDGWRAGPVQSSASGTINVGRGVSLRRSYAPNGRQAAAYAQLIADDQGIIATALKFENDQKLRARSRSTPVQIDGVGTAYLRFSPRYRNAVISMLIGGRFFLTVSANRIDSPDVVKKIMKGWDFAALKKAGGID